MDGYSFDSPAELVEVKEVPSYGFNDELRRTSCCGRFLFMHANSLVNSVHNNGRKLDPVMVEAMHTDPQRDKKLLLNFNNKLESRHMQWLRSHPG